MYKILLVEDDESFGGLLQNYLKISGYETTWLKDGAKGYSEIMKNDYHLCILDVMMPNLDGFSLARKIRQAKNQIPFFFLTAKKLKEDIINGYKLGAEDYLTKPFDTEVLLLKIEAILNRSARQIEAREQTSFQFGKFEFTAFSRILKTSDSEIKLTPKEAELLKLLCIHQNKILPRETALNKIWGENNYFTKRSMDVYITKLRKRLSSDVTVKIETFHHIGFQLTIF